MRIMHNIESNLVPLKAVKPGTVFTIPPSSLIDHGHIYFNEATSAAWLVAAGRGRTIIVNLKCGSTLENLDRVFGKLVHEDTLVHPHPEAEFNLNWNRP